MDIKTIGKTTVLSALLLTSLAIPAFAASKEEINIKSLEDYNQEYQLIFKNQKKDIFSKSLFSSSIKAKLLAFDSQLLYEAEPNNDSYNANYLPLDTFITGTFNEYDIDTFKVSVPYDCAFWIGASADSPTDVRFNLYDTNDNFLMPKFGGLNSDTNIRSFVYEVTAGTYYIKAFNNYSSASTAPYLLRANILQDNTGGDTTAPSKPRVNTIDDNDLVITGVAEPNANIGIKYQNKIAAANFADNTGRFKVSLKSPFKAGSKLDIVAMDLSGNISSPTAVTVIDKTPPRLTANPINSKSTSIKGLTEPGASVKLYKGSKIVGKATVDSKGNYRITIKKQKKGTKFTIVSADKAGNKKSVLVGVR